jgi:hypothetical protein
MIYKNNKLLLYTQPNYEYIVDRIDDKTYGGRAKYYYTELFKYPYFFEIDLLFANKTENLQYRFENNNLLKNFDIYSGKGEFIEHCPIFIVVGDFIYLSTTTSDYIYKINLSDFTIADKFKINSNYGIIGVKPTEINADDDVEYSKQLGIWAKNRVINNIIDGIYYDKNKKIFYVLVAMQINGFEELDNPGRNFSIIVYNESFKKQGEYLFEKEKYNYRKGVTLTSEGIMLQRKSENLSRENYGTQTFDFYQFN